MIRPNEVILTLEQVAKSQKLYLIEVSDYNEYIDNKSTGKRLGTRYSVVAPDNKYTAFTVKVAEATSVITQEQIDSIKGQPVQISFDGFEGRFYRLRGSNDYGFTATAAKASIVKG